MCSRIYFTKKEEMSRSENDFFPCTKLLLFLLLELWCNFAMRSDSWFHFFSWISVSQDYGIKYLRSCISMNNSTADEIQWPFQYSVLWLAIVNPFISFFYDLPELESKEWNGHPNQNTMCQKVKIVKYTSIFHRIY